MTLPISLTCKTQEPSRTRTLRGTRGTSTGEGPRRRWQRRRRGEAGRLPRPARLLDEAVAPSMDAGAGGQPPPQPAPSHTATWWCPLGSRPLWPSWDHSGSSLLPGHACPRPEQASLSAPFSCLPLLCCSLIFHLCPTWKSQFSRRLVGGGDVREGAPACSPSSPPPQPPLAWRSRWGDGHTPRCRGVTGCSAD